MAKTGWKGKNVQAAALYAISFLSPFMVGHPQDAVGIIVNAALVLAALRLDVLRAAPVIVIPVIGVLSRALLIGPFLPFLPVTVFLAVAGNAILFIFIVKVKKKLLNLASGVIAKTAFMFICASALVSLSILPAAVLATMGLFQLYTAAVGGAAVVIALEALEMKGRQKKK